MYAITHFATPVLNTENFQTCFGGAEGNTLPLDTQQLLRPVETILLPHSKLQLLEKVGTSPIWRIRTSEYESDSPLYIDERFIMPVPASFPERKRLMPTYKEMLRRLEAQIGARYIWGGNWPEGIPQLLCWYKPSIKREALGELLHDTWQLKGVDCSGLLYFASHGYTPRNTQELVSWGKGVSIAGKTAKAISALLQPLDLIAWRGHVLIALDRHTLIESRGGAGVIVCASQTRLEEILSERKAADGYLAAEPCFVVRRFREFPVPERNALHRAALSFH